MTDTPRGYPVPAPTDVVSLDAVQDLADAIDTDVTAVAAAAGSALASHEADTTSVHGIADTALLVRTSDTGTVTSTMLAGSIAPSKVTGTAVVNTIVDAKGDLFAATAADTPARLAVANAGDILTPTPAAATGLAWRAPSPITASATGVTLDRANPVYNFTGGSVTATLPTASTHTGVRFLIRNAGTGTVTVSGISGLTIPGTGYVDVVSDGTNWLVLDGAYSTNSVGLASYRWNHVTSAWRLIAYDSGFRNVIADLANGWAGADGTSHLLVRRTLSHVTFIGYYLTAAAATSSTLYSLPLGFAVTVAHYRQPVSISGGAPTGLLTVASTLVVAPYAGATDLEFFATYSAEVALPTSLPGTQVTTPV